MICKDVEDIIYRYKHQLEFVDVVKSIKMIDRLEFRKNIITFSIKSNAFHAMTILMISISDCGSLKYHENCVRCECHVFGYKYNWGCFSALKTLHDKYNIIECNRNDVIRKMKKSSTQDWFENIKEVNNSIKKIKLKYRYGYSKRVKNNYASYNIKLLDSLTNRFFNIKRIIFCPKCGENISYYHSCNITLPISMFWIRNQKI